MELKQQDFALVAWEANLETLYRRIATSSGQLCLTMGSVYSPPKVIRWVPNNVSLGYHPVPAPRTSHGDVRCRASRLGFVTPECWRAPLLQMETWAPRGSLPSGICVDICRPPFLSPMYILWSIGIRQQSLHGWPSFCRKYFLRCNIHDTSSSSLRGYQKGYRRLWSKGIWRYGRLNEKNAVPLQQYRYMCKSNCINKCLIDELSYSGLKKVNKIK